MGSREKRWFVHEKKSMRFWTALNQAGYNPELYHSATELMTLLGIKGNNMFYELMSMKLIECERVPNPNSKFDGDFRAIYAIPDYEYNLVAEGTHPKMDAIKEKISGRKAGRKKAHQEAEVL